MNFLRLYKEGGGSEFYYKFSLFFKTASYNIVKLGINRECMIPYQIGVDWGEGDGAGGGGVPVDRSQEQQQIIYLTGENCFLKGDLLFGEESVYLFIYLIFSHSDSDSPLQTESVSSTMLARL